MAENRIEDSKIKKNVIMESDVKDTKQIFKGSEAESLSQQLKAQEQKLSLFGFGNAKGRYAIIGIVVVAVCYLVYQFLIRHSG
jgi:hypothetical protein